jgi:hypothetical protein
MYKALKFQIVLGTHPGYYHNNEKVISKSQLVSLYKDIALSVSSKYDVYPSCTIIEGVTVYEEEKGCPPNGESTYILYGSCGSKCNDVDNYKQAVIETARRLKEALSQEFIRLEITEIYATDFY